jgi:predicted lipoprotein
MTDISNAIQSLNTKGGNSHEYVMTGTPTNEAEYNSQVKFISGADANGTAIFGTQAYSWSEISAELTSLQTAYDNNEYQRDRAKEYPSIADQLDDIFHNGIDGWKTTIQVTKDKYPK